MTHTLIVMLIPGDTYSNSITVPEGAIVESTQVVELNAGNGAFVLLAEAAEGLAGEVMERFAHRKRVEA